MDKPPLRPPVTTAKPGSRNMHDQDNHDVKVPVVPEDGLLQVLHFIIHLAVRILAILMTVVILWGLADVVNVIYQHAVAQPYWLLTLPDLLAIFGAFMVVLIAIEIFINITLYIERDVLPIKMVVATALMAMARKVIALDIKELESVTIFAIAALVLALGLTYWLISYKPKPIQPKEER